MRSIGVLHRNTFLKRGPSMNFRRDFIKFPFAAALVGSLALTALPSFAQSVTLLNVSYDPTRDYLWSLGEYPGYRWVYAMDASSF